MDIQNTVTKSIKSSSKLSRDLKKKKKKEINGKAVENSFF